MNLAVPLYNDQGTYDGTAACCVIACFMAKHVLSFDEAPQLGSIDQIVRQGSAAWRRLSAGYMTPSEALSRIPELNTIGLRCSEHVFATGPVHDGDGHVVVRGAREVLLDWLRDNNGDSVAIITRSGYSYTVWLYEGLYYVMDSHYGVLQDRSQALKMTEQIAGESDVPSGGLITYTFANDVADYVVNFIEPEIPDPRCLISTSEMEIDILVRV